ncbi:MAG: hypothetical protein A2W99_12875 [Bacteroidetes bacterium GWF2_33_16]|nr:MAG: hypothetical protein A2X00_01400 [Bacteroidetes bacterium GWE2_32_14]OFY06746.1 MAG: hypothetical protein A2W99_12875 [Bacteroidetes bacterium GWF2_33_16]
MSKNNAFDNGIVILGAGNVATHLAIAFFKSNNKVRFVYNRSINSAKELALQINAEYSDDLKHVPSDADLYLISVKDDAIEGIANKLNIKHGIIVHTAGGISLDIFANTFENFGVFYPLQTFTKSRKIDLSEVPILIEANNEITKSKLFQLAFNITKSVFEIDSEKRKAIHLAAVFSCNFVNHMYFISSELMQNSNSTFDLLKPLIIETVNKAIEMQPENAQTGPALRNDKKVIENHIKMLSRYPEFENIYRFVSDSIYKSNSKREN